MLLQWSFITATGYLLFVQAGTTVISDDRVRSLDVSPVLGRGYSIGTNSFQSSCLLVDETSTPSYNYDYYFTDLTKSSETDSNLHGKISASFGYGFVKASVSASMDSKTHQKSEYHHMVATMRVERYYSSVMEGSAYLTSTAQELLESGDFIGFFTACGPNYIRGIRRAMEVTSIFSFKAVNEDTASKFAAELKVKILGRGVGGGKISGSQSHKMSEESMMIKIVGYGLALDDEHASNTLVATTLEQYNNVMDYAFRRMTVDQGEGAGKQTGMVYGMEIVPWVDNTAFQVAAQLPDAIVEVPIDRHLLPRVNNTGYCDNGLDADATGRCCDGPEGAKTDTVLENEANKDGPTKPVHINGTGICRPKAPLSNTRMKHNMVTNGEFVAMLDSTLRSKLDSLFTLELCVERARSIPERFDYQYLKTMDTAKYDKVIEMDFTVKELKMMLDPHGNFDLVKYVSNEIDEYVTMFYSPCLNALIGGSDPNDFMAKPWYEYEECNRLSCLAENMRWDRDKGDGCVPSLMSNPDIENASYADKEPAFCTKGVVEDENGKPTEACKHTNKEHAEFEKKAQNCWDAFKKDHGETSTWVLPSHLLSHFCLPELSDRKADDAMIKVIKTNVEQCITGKKPTPS